MRIEVLCTGDELLTGLTADTNSPFFMEGLLRLGEKVAWSQTVGDSRADIARALREISGRADAVLVSGGLGPTADDVTLEAAAEVAGVALLEDAAVLEAIRARFAARRLVVTPNNARQARVPQGALAVPNPVGSAPLVIQALGRCTAFFVPGVPREYRHLVEHEVLPRLALRLAQDPHRTYRASRLVRTVGLAESHLDAQMAPLVPKHPQVVFGYRTQAPENHLKLLAEANSQAEADRALANAEAEARRVLGAYVFGVDGQTFAEVLVRLLEERGATLALAESCTGGLAAEYVTAVSGASRVFLGGVVAYANAMKTQWAEVPPGLLEAHGAVSAPVAEALAAGVRRQAGATYGVGITGIAGPTGGTPEKPVGTVFVALAGPSGGASGRYLFGKERERVRQFAAYTALDMVRRHVLGLPPP